MSNIKVRLLSAIAIISSVFLAYYFFEKTGLTLLGFAIAALSIYEYNRISFQKKTKLLQVVFVLFSYGIFYSLFYHPLEALNAFIFLSLSYIIVAILEAKDVETSQVNINRAVIGFFYVGLLPALFCRFFLFHPDGLIYFMITLICVISTDVFAYLAGTSYGKTPLHKTVSPKKTVEGFLAGICGALLFTLLFVYFINWPHKPLLLIPFIAFASIAGQFGDLFESLLKRNAQVKDSGKLLPGHGGVLDRIDSLLFASPVFLLYAKFLDSTFV